MTKTNNTTDMIHTAAGTDDGRLDRAARHIDAVDLGNGRWAHYANETRTYWIVTADELENLCDYLDSEDPAISRDAYSHWCAGTCAEEMPRGWEPA